MKVSGDSENIHVGERERNLVAAILNINYYKRPEQENIALYLRKKN